MAVKKGSNSWLDKSEELLSTYIKKAKNPKGHIVVLSLYGDVLVSAGKKMKADWTSIGSILASVRGASRALNLLLKQKQTVLHFSSQKSGYWMNCENEDWIVVGFELPYKKELLTPFMKHLKKVKSEVNKNFGGPEALEGMSEAIIDSALKGEMG